MDSLNSTSKNNSSEGNQISKVPEAGSVNTIEKIEHDPITYFCCARKKTKFDLELFDLNYDYGSIKLTPTLVQIQTSRRRFPKGEPKELIVWKEKILDVSMDEKRITFTVDGDDEYVLTFLDTDTSKYVFDLIFGNLSESAKREEIEVSQVYDLIYSHKSTAWVTSSIITLCVSIFVLMCLQGYGVFSSNPMMAIQWGSKFPPLIVDGEYWRLLTSGFLHFGLIHLALNVYIFYQVGAHFERIFGSFYFLALYIFCLIFASIVGAWWGPEKNSAGASGAIFGIFSAVTTYAFLAKNKLPKSISRKMIKDGIFFFVINLSLGFSMTVIDNAVHMGGLIGGVIFGYIFSRPLVAGRSTNVTPDLLLRIGASSVIVFCTWFTLIEQNKDFQKKLEAPRNSYYLSLGRSFYDLKNFDQALPFFHIAADKGDKYAPAILSYMYSNGEGTEKNTVKARYWLEVGAQRDNPGALFNFGLSFLKGDGVPKDVNRGYELLMKSADLGLDRGRFYTAEAILADQFDKKIEITIANQYLRELSSSTAGMELVESLALKGNSFALYVLGKFHQMGQGVKIDHQLAIRYFRESADKSNALGEYELGLCYLNGEGVPVDKVEAKKWLKRSADHGYELAKLAIQKF